MNNLKILHLRYVDCAFMDIYMIARMFRKFDKNPQHKRSYINVVYAGDVHTVNLFNFLQYVGSQNYDNSIEIILNNRQGVELPKNSILIN